MWMILTKIWIYLQYMWVSPVFRHVCHDVNCSRFIYLYLRIHLKSDHTSAKSNSRLAVLLITFHFLTLLGVDPDIEEFPESSCLRFLVTLSLLYIFPSEFSVSSIHDFGLIFPGWNTKGYWMFSEIFNIKYRNSLLLLLCGVLCLGICW